MPAAFPSAESLISLCPLYTAIDFLKICRIGIAFEVYNCSVKFKSCQELEEAGWKADKAGLEEGDGQKAGSAPGFLKKLL